jgi:mono/diheme cytochrome c family protein
MRSPDRPPRASAALRRSAWLWMLLACLVDAAALSAADAVSYGRDIQPILTRSCFACHGPDDEVRQADLRLDVREAAIAAGAIVPGDAAASELVRRVTSDVADERMPPAESHPPLTDRQRELLREWIDAGAEYQPHWAFVAPVGPPPPSLTDVPADLRGWSRTPVDRFVLEQLLARGMRPSPEADRRTLIRRLSLDLIGLPPTPAELDHFLQDDAPDAYERLVERLLASPHYGERWGRAWLDLARYSDTNGYEKDRDRSIWPYRDWVIRALNADLPYDQFSIEQLAGDMLPAATLDQQIATGFHRNTMLNEEGGIDPLEFRHYAMVDRVATTGLVWLGLTTGCAQCHSHKYDPLTHLDYHRCMALLNNADEPDLLLPAHDDSAREATLARIAELEAALPGRFAVAANPTASAEERAAAFEAAFTEWLRVQREAAVAWAIVRPTAMSTNLPKLELEPDGSIFSAGDFTKRDVYSVTLPLAGFEGPITGLRLEVLPDDRLPARGPGRCYYEGPRGDFFLSELTATTEGQLRKFAAGSHSYGKNGLGSGSTDAANVFDGDGSTGWSTSGREGEAHQLVLRFAEPFRAEGELQLELLFERHYVASLGRFRVSLTTDDGELAASTLPSELMVALADDGRELSPETLNELRGQFARVAPELVEARQEIDSLRTGLKSARTTLVMQERPDDNPRATYLRHRGEYLQPREEVSPGIPAFLSATQAEPRNRLEFARWLVSVDNPLAARVAVNRAWTHLWGRGLVDSDGDFGTQSDPPSHPALLDWLAVEFIREGWSTKSLHRLMVTSAAYRQSSEVPDEVRASDPENKWLGRGARFRLDAECVRDLMLRASGRLDESLGGPSVYPPQPASVTELAYGSTAWPESTGPDRFRRSLYTFSKRTAPFAAYAVFDAPSGETCLVQRDRSNTPLQSLALLNDAMYLELARGLALAAWSTHADVPDACANELFQRLLSRPATPDELARVLAFYESQRERIAGGEIIAGDLAGMERPTAELAAWVVTARALMGLDETLTRP